MSNEEILRQVESLLERKLTREEYKFLAVASQALKQEKKPSHPTAKPNARIA